MEKRFKTKGRRHRRAVDEIGMSALNQSDECEVFTVNDAEWGDVAPSASSWMNTLNVSDDSDVFTVDDTGQGDVTSSATPSLNIGRHRHLSSLFEDGGVESYTNAGFEDFQRQESRMYSPFDTDTVFLFNSPGKNKVHIRKQLAVVWFDSCLFRLFQCLQSLCSCDCSCRDQRGVHCLHRFKKYVVRKLKVVQGIICLVSIIQSGMVFMPLGTNTSDFDGQCLLYSDIFIQWISRNGTVALDLPRSTFGSKTDCDFTTFINVVVAIVGLFFIWFFIRSSKVFGLEQSQVKLQLPVFLCYFILLVSVLVSSIKITAGFSRWCYNIVMNNPSPVEKQRLRCKDYETLKWTTENRSQFYMNSLLAEVSTWLLTLTLFLQCSVTSVQLYRDLKEAYEEIEIPHTKLDESSESSDDERSRDILLSDDGLPPLPVYKVEYKKHQVLSKVVVHRDKVTSPFPKFDSKSTFVLNKEKFKRNVSDSEGFGGMRSKRKVDFPLQIIPGRRRKLNWTGSCEELHSRRDYEDQVKRYWAGCCREWHGFDTDISSPDDSVWTAQKCDWLADFGSKSKKIWARNSFEWPTKLDVGSQIGKQFLCNEWHGFESNFVTQDEKTATSLPSDWQKFDMNSGDQIAEQFDWLDQDLKPSDQTKDPWTFGTSSLHTVEENNDHREGKSGKEESVVKERDNKSQKVIASIDSESEKR